MTIYDSYKTDLKGSLATIPALLKNGLKVTIFTGDWDDVVPFTDTFSNLDRMNLRQQGKMVPWMIN